MEATFRVYVPLSWHKFGVNYGVIPQVRYTLTNNWLSTEPILWEAPDRFKGLPAHYKLAGVGSDASVLMQRISASARGYVTLTAEDPYGGIDFAWGRRADELIYQRYTQGLFYIHQKSPWHYPVQSAESFRKYSAYSPFHDSPFITVQLQGSWFLTEPLDSPWEMHL